MATFATSKNLKDTNLQILSSVLCINASEGLCLLGCCVPIAAAFVHPERVGILRNRSAF